MKRLDNLSPIHIFLFICVVYIAGFFAHAAYLKKTVYGDGIYYYSWLRSVIVDHNVNFSNEYKELGGVQPNTSSGLVGNKYSVGPALLWAPAFITTHTLLRGDGYGLPYQLAVGLMSVGFTLVGFLLLGKLLQKYFSAMVSLVTLGAVAGATNILFYGSLDVVNSHALTFFAGILFLSLLLQNEKKNWYAIGGSLGLIALIRPQDIIIGLLLIPFLNTKHIWKIVIGFIVAFSPQLIAWQLLYGQFWMSPYLTGAEGFHLLQPHLLGVLFSLPNGFYLWTPMALLGTIGLFVGNTKQIPYQKIMISVFLTELYIVSTWSTWWQGASYSGRMLVSSLPLLAFGIASIFSWLEKYHWTKIYYLVTIILPLSLMNMLSITYFLLSLH